jgi:hypothetical protein
MKTNRPILNFNKRKAIILFIDYFIYSVSAQIIYELLCLILNKERFYPWIFRLIFFLIYFSLCELKFNRTIGMSLFRVELDNPNEKKFSIDFIIYSVTSILDRTILVPIYALIAFLNYKSKFISEKLSGLMWKEIEKN